MEIWSRQWILLQWMWETVNDLLGKLCPIIISRSDLRIGSVIKDKPWVRQVKEVHMKPRTSFAVINTEVSKIKIKAHILKTVTCIPNKKKQHWTMFCTSVEAHSYSVAMICGLLQSHTQTGTISIGVNCILQRLIAYLYWTEKWTATVENVKWTCLSDIPRNIWQIRL